jgi:hypothetical protein
MKKAPWLRVFVEGTVIVGSILLAFGIDAWWDERGEAQRRAGLISALVADFDEADAALDGAMDAHNLVENVTARWLRLARSTSPTPDLAAVSDSLISQMLFTGRFDPPRGSIEALLNAGDISVLADARLGEMLSGWPAQVAAFNEREQNAINVYHTWVIPYLMSAEVPISDLTWYPRGLQLELGPEFEFPVEPRHTRGYTLLSDVGWENAVSMLWWAQHDVQERERSLRDDLMEIRRRLQAAGETPQ